MQYSMYTFDTKGEAREWLREHFFGPRPKLGLGVWVNADGEMVQAFLNSTNRWTVSRWTAPNPDNFITA